MIIQLICQDCDIIEGIVLYANNLSSAVDFFHYSAIIYHLKILVTMKVLCKIYRLGWTISEI